MEYNFIQDDIVVKIARTGKEFEDGCGLFRRYAQTLDLDLGFQNFPEELEKIDQLYNKPGGALLIAYKDEIAIGCVAVREQIPGTAELKRLYVHEDYRNYKIGRKLLDLSIGIAKELGYKSIRLDTLPNQTEAQRLYRSFGFYEIAAYRFNPVPGTVYMEKKLD